MNVIKELSIDLETYSDIDIKKSGVYKYTESDAFELRRIRKQWSGHRL